MPDTITRLFKEAYDTFPPLEGKPSDDDLLVIRETLLPLLMVIPYDQLNGVHFPFPHGHPHRCRQVRSRTWQQQIRTALPPPPLQ